MLKYWLDLYAATSTDVLLGRIATIMLVNRYALTDTLRIEYRAIRELLAERNTAGVYQFPAML